MNKVLIGFTTFIASLALFATPAFASVQNWDVSGTHVIHYVLNSTDYPNDVTFTQVGSALTGTLGYPSGASSYLVTGTLTGTISGNTIEFTVTYSDRSYLRSNTGTIASDGTVSGYWNDTNPPTNDFGTWSLSGIAVPFCKKTGFFRDNAEMTAAVIDPVATVSGEIDATGCNIGIYYSPAYIGTGLVDHAHFHGSNYYGIVVQKASVDVKNSEIYSIGDHPDFTGAQHGIGIYYANVDGKSNGDCTLSDVETTGKIDNNKVSSYQKGGMVFTCPGTNVSVTNNTVTGEGPIGYIAQNGIQISSGAIVSELSNNTVTGNAYLTGLNMSQGNGPWVSCGLLFYNSGMPKNQASFMSVNTIRNNRANLCNF